MSKRQRYSLLNLFLTLVLVGLVGFGLTKGDRAKAGNIITVDEASLTHDNSTHIDTVSVTGTWERETLPGIDEEDVVQVELDEITTSSAFVLPDTGYSGTFGITFEVPFEDHTFEYAGDAYYSRRFKVINDLIWGGQGVPFVATPSIPPNEEITILDVEVPYEVVVHNEETGEDLLNIGLTWEGGHHLSHEFGYTISVFVDGHIVKTYEYAYGVASGSEFLQVPTGEFLTEYPVMIDHDPMGYIVTGRLKYYYSPYTLLDTDNEYFPHPGASPSPTPTPSPSPNPSTSPSPTPTPSPSPSPSSSPNP